MAKTKRTIGSLTHADFGFHIEIPGVIRGILWGIQHVGVMGDIREPFTRLTVLRFIGASEATRGLPPDTIATLADPAALHALSGESARKAEGALF